MKINTLTDAEQALLDEIVGDHKNGALEEIIGKLHDEVARLRNANTAAPLSPLPFNINNYVLVRLTDRGRACLRENFDRLNASFGGRLSFGYTPPKEDEGGWSRWQAWDLMVQLGPHISIGAESPFDTTIRIERSGA